MKQRYGVILFDTNELIFRVYEVLNAEWKLTHYHCDILPNTVFDTTSVMEKIAEFFSTEHAQHIAEWKTASRHVPQTITDEVSRAIGIKIEPITPDREQELLCKGLFTELW